MPSPHRPLSTHFPHTPYQLVAQRSLYLDMFQYGGYKRIALEVAAHLFKVELFLEARTVGAEAGHGSQGEFFLGILVDHTVQAYNGLFPLLDDMDDVVRRYVCGIDAIELLQLVVCPCPFVSIVVLVHPLEFGIDMFQTVDRTGFDTVYQRVYFAFGGYQPGNIHPLAAADRGIGSKAGTYFLIVPEVDILQTFDYRVAEELVDSDFVETDALHQCGIAYLGAVEGIDVGQFARSVAQVFQRFPPLEHLLYGIGAQKVVVDEVQFVGISAPVALRPFLGIADSAYASQVDTRHEVGGVVLLYQIREGQVGSIGMVDVTSHNEGERPYPRRPQDVRVGSGLGSAFQRSLVDSGRVCTCGCSGWNRNRHS